MPLIPILNLKQNRKKGWKNEHYLHTAAIIWMLITVWLCKIYTPRPFSDDFLLYAIGLLGSGAFTMIFYLHIKPYPVSLIMQSEQQIQKAEFLYEKYGNPSVSYTKTYGDKQLFFGTKVKGFIAYQSAAGIAVVFNEPVCANQPYYKATLIREFEFFCQTIKLSPCYYKVNKTSLSLFNKMGKKSLQIGQEAIVDLQNFNLLDDQYMPLRDALDEIEGSGLQTKLHLPPLKRGFVQQLEMVSDEWTRTTRKKETTLLQARFNAEEIKDQQVISLENEEGRVLGFLNIVPGAVHKQVTYHLIRKTNDAPKEIFDILIIKMIEYAKACGHHSLSMGTAPFTGTGSSKNLPEKLLKLVYERTPLFKSYYKLNDFRKRFNPQWQKQFLIYDRSHHLLLLPIAIKKIMKQGIGEVLQLKSHS